MRLEVFVARLVLCGTVLGSTACGDGGGEAVDAGTDGSGDADADTDTDADSDCECSGVGAECDLAGCLIVTCDGCHITGEVDCCANSNPSQTYYCDDDGEAPSCSWYDPDCPDPGSTDCSPDTWVDICDDEVTIETCWGTGYCGFFNFVDCYDPVYCPCGSGCADGADGGPAECWCCDDDGGMDAGL
jgi:hypothetical protein